MNLTFLISLKNLPMIPIIPQTVLVEEEATLKRFYYDESAGVVTLVSENPTIAPMIYQGETLNHIRVLGLAVGLTRKI